MPRFRFTVRSMMVGVAIVGAALGLASMKSRSDEFARKAHHFADREARMRELMEFLAKPEPGSHPTSIRNIRKICDYILTGIEHDKRMRRKYERAARYPWLTVAPDPPEPK